MREKDDLEEARSDKEIILNWIFQKCFEGMYWIEVAQFRDRQCVLVNAVTKTTVP